MTDNSLLKKFRTAARHALFGGVFAAGMLAAEKTEAQEIRILPPLIEPVTIDSILARSPEAFNEFLIHSARVDLKNLEQLARTDYSHELDSIETALNHYLFSRADTLVSNGAVVIDPTYIDIAFALDAPMKKTVYDLFIREGLLKEGTDSLGVATDYIVRDFFFSYIMTRHYNPYDTSFTSVPAVRRNPGHAAIMVPMSEIAPATRIPGFTHRENLDFINRHEAWHVLDTKVGEEDLPRVDYSTMNDPDSLKGRELMMIVFAHHLKKETFADVAAIGDMIRAGSPVSVIDILARARGTSNMGAVAATKENYEANFNVTHMSVPSLQALQRAIARMGEVKFRKLDDDAARELYYGIVDKNTLDTKAVKRWLSYRDAKKAKKTLYNIASLFNGRTKKAIRYHDIVSQKPRTQMPVRPLTPLEKSVDAEIDSLDPTGSLIHATFEKHGKITPETVIRTYVEFQNNLRKEIDKQPERAEFLYAMRLQLRAAFLVKLTGIDYAAINAEYGVKPADLLPKKADKGLKN